MIIIRKPRTKGWQGRMSSYLIVAYHAFAAAELYEKDSIDKAYAMILEGGKNLRRAVNAGGFFSFTDMFKWIENQKSNPKRS